MDDFDDIFQKGYRFNQAWRGRKAEIERLGGNPVEIVDEQTGEVTLEEYFGPPGDCHRLGLAVSQDWDPIPGGLCIAAWPGKAGPLRGPDKTRKPREAIQ